MNRQRRTGVRTATLVRKIQQQMTAPATLLLAGGIGFILGELTQRQTTKSRGAADKVRTPETTPLSAEPHDLDPHLIHGLASSLDDEVLPSTGSRCRVIWF